MNLLCQQYGLFFFDTVYIHAHSLLYVAVGVFQWMRVLKLWTGRVEIVNPYYPLYIQSGTTLTVICQSAKRSAIEWVQQTAETKWNDTAVVPTIGQDFTIQSCTDEPSGFSKSTLFRSNVSLSARGMYQCKDRDESSSYAIWVTVLYSMLSHLCVFIQYWKHLNCWY